MLIIAIVPVIVCIVGLLLYVLASNAKTSELGRIMFAVGLLVTLLAMATHVVRIGT